MRTKIFATLLLLICLAVTSKTFAQDREFRKDYYGYGSYIDVYEKIWIPAGTLSYGLSAACNSQNYMSAVEVGIWCNAGNQYIYCTSYYNWWGISSYGSMNIPVAQELSIFCSGVDGTGSIYLNW